ncbi:AzlC family ABC transporter permease [Orrella daihaiensis]|uniref:AzlC family ABC transporter permease n=1 Tax=Orrella daihaiensis TaxID=2782176 RepID=A0ABY4ANZ2_9BURK|nr:AzlC family ABC transporter permease [Orrella daihaiensis]
MFALEWFFVSSETNLSIKAECQAARREALIAVRPALIATFTWGLVTGVAMVKSGLTESAAVWMTLFVYAGSAQLTSLPLIASGAPLWLIFAAGLIVNLRFLIFSAALQPYFQSLPWYKRLTYGYFTTDMSFVLFMPRFGDADIKGTAAQRSFFLATIVPGWFTWQTSSLLGIALGSLVPTAWSLDYAAVLALMAITIPLANSRPMLVSMLAAGVTAWISQGLPLRLGLLAAVVVGIVSGIWAETALKKKR